MDNHPIIRYVQKIADLPGDIIECGSYKLDSAIRMARLCPDKTVYACDTFSGMPIPGFLDGHRKGDFTPDWEEVKSLASEVPNIMLVRGLFQESLPFLNLWKFSLIYVDCDLYESGRYAIDMLWPKLITGGLLVVDDYANPACKGIKMLMDEMFGGRFMPDENNFVAVRKA